MFALVLLPAFVTDLARLYDPSMHCSSLVPQSKNPVLQIQEQVWHPLLQWPLFKMASFTLLYLLNVKTFIYLQGLRTKMSTEYEHA